MYIVKYGNRYLHNPSRNIILSDTNVDIEDNSVGYCDFTIYPGHELYNVIKERDQDNEVVISEDDVILFSGYIYEITESFDTTKTVKCKGDLDYLYASVVRPYSTRVNTIGDKAPDTVDGYFDWLIQQHNNQVPENKRFTVGINQGSELDPNNFIYRESKQYPSTLSEITEKITNNLGGFLRVRWENGIRYIDLLSKWKDISTQIIQFGVNLTDYSSNIDSKDIYSYVIPLGAKYQDTEYEYDDGYRESTDEEIVEDKTYYVRQYEENYNIREFEEGVDYYEKTQVVLLSEDTTPYSGIHYCVYSLRGYVETEDARMDPNKEYYTANPTEVINLTEFEEGVDYYERIQITFITSDGSPVEGVDYYKKVVSGDKETYQRVSVTTFDAGTTYYEQEYDYVKTADITPVSDKKYYVYTYDNFSSVYNLKRFLRYPIYYELYEDVYKEDTDTSIIFGLTTELRDVEVYEFEEKVVYYELEDVYYKTEDEEPQNDKSYYTIRKHQFSEVDDLGRFKYYEVYYEYHEELDQSEVHINIKEYADGDLGDGYYKKGDAIYNYEAVKRFGYVGLIYKNEDIHETVYLKNKAIKELEKVLSPTKSIDVKAVDMHFINNDSKPIKIGEYVRIISKPHGLDSYFLCTSISLNLNNPQNSTYSFGTKLKTFTGEYVDDKEQLESTSNNVANLSNSVEQISQIVYKTEKIVNEYKVDLSSVLSSLSYLKSSVSSIISTLTNEINSRIQNDSDHNDRLTILESHMPNYITNALFFSNVETTEISNTTESIGYINFKVELPVYLHVNVECIFDVETDIIYGNTDYYNEVQVEVQYVLNGILNNWKPIETYLDGKHLLSTSYGFNISTTSVQSFELRLKVTGGKIKIASQKAKVSLIAQSIQYIWDGVINAYDEIPIHDFNINRVPIGNENLDIDETQIQNPDATDYVPYFVAGGYLMDINDNVEMEVSTNA